MYALILSAMKYAFSSIFHKSTFEICFLFKKRKQLFFMKNEYILHINKFIYLLMMNDFIFIYFQDCNKYCIANPFLTHYIYLKSIEILL
jgi:hypothetical protein